MLVSQRAPFLVSPVFAQSFSNPGMSYPPLGLAKMQIATAYSEILIPGLRLGLNICISGWLTGDVIGLRSHFGNS